MKREALPALCAILLLSACDGSDAKPSGQVIATIDGEEITASELQLEIGETAGNNPQGDPAKAAMTSLVSRKILVAEALGRGLDKSPAAAMIRNRADEFAMVQLLQRDIAKDAPKVWDGDVQEYVSKHPAMFEKRQLQSVDQLIVPKASPDLLKQLESLDTMAQIEGVLSTNRVDFVRSANVLDTVRLTPEAAARVSGLGKGEVMIFTTPAGGLEISVITDARPAPLVGQNALRIARGIISNRQADSEVQRKIDEIVKAGQKRIKLNEKYGKPEDKSAGK